MSDGVSWIPLEERSVCLNAETQTDGAILIGVRNSLVDGDPLAIPFRTGTGRIGPGSFIECRPRNAIVV